mgnify:FL=1
MRKKKQKRDYECPECNVHELQFEKFICASVTLDPQGSSEENWNNDKSIDGDHEEWIGSSTEVAP